MKARKIKRLGVEKGRCRIVLQITFATLSIHSHSGIPLPEHLGYFQGLRCPKKNVMKEICDLAKTCIYIFVKFQIKT